MSSSAALGKLLNGRLISLPASSHHKYSAGDEMSVYGRKLQGRATAFVSIRRESVERWKRRKYLVFSGIAHKKRGIDTRNARDSVLVAELAGYLRMGEFV